MRGPSLRSLAQDLALPACQASPPGPASARNPKTRRDATDGPQFLSVFRPKGSATRHRPLHEPDHEFGEVVHGEQLDELPELVFLDCDPRARQPGCLANRVQPGKHWRAPQSRPPQHALCTTLIVKPMIAPIVWRTASSADIGRRVSGCTSRPRSSRSERAILQHRRPPWAPTLKVTASRLEWSRRKLACARLKMRRRRRRRRRIVPRRPPPSRVQPLPARRICQQDPELAREPWSRPTSSTS